MQYQPGVRGVVSGARGVVLVYILIEYQKENVILCTHECRLRVAWCARSVFHNYVLAFIEGMACEGCFL